MCEPPRRLDTSGKSKPVGCHAEQAEWLCSHLGTNPFEANPQSYAKPERKTKEMALDPLLLEVLACPEDKGPLIYFVDEERLYNPRLKRSYAVSDGIPNMLIDEAQTVDDQEHERLISKAKDTDAIMTMSKREEGS
jgi:uncharacterized protein